MVKKASGRMEERARGKIALQSGHLGEGLSGNELSKGVRNFANTATKKDHARRSSGGGGQPYILRNKKQIKRKRREVTTNRTSKKREALYRLGIIANPNKGGVRKISRVQRKPKTGEPVTLGKSPIQKGKKGQRRHAKSTRNGKRPGKSSKAKVGRT